MIGKPCGDTLIRKSNLRPGDGLYLTKPIGIGVLLAAHMRSACSGRDFHCLMGAILERQHELARIAAGLGIDAGTDVTGFGLAGHLIEMLTASNVAAEIQLDAIPLLSGAIQAVASGIESSLAPANRNAELSIAAGEAVRQRTEYNLLFDPQTCGGLLIGVDEDKAQRFIAEVTARGIRRPVRIGQVTDDQRDPPLTIL